MKHTILKLAFLFLTMSVIRSSRENNMHETVTKTTTRERSSLPSCNEYAINTVCKKSPLLKEVNAVSKEQAAASDNDLPLAPISRFILLQ